jgi:large subunit ribosomal protein L25
MEVGKLTVTVRNAGSKGAARRLRAEGKVPGVCYGASTDGRIEPLPITVDVKALRASLDPVRKRNTVIALTIEGGATPRSLSALVKDYQLDPVRRDIIHVDLIAVDPDKEVLAVVPLEFTGKPKGTIHGGQLRFLLRQLELRAKPADIPVKLTIDVSELDIGDVTHVAAIALPPGVSAVTGRDLAVVTLAAPEEDKGGAAAEGAAVAEGAAAAAPAAAAKDAKASAAKGAAPAKAAPAAKPAAKK